MKRFLLGVGVVAFSTLFMSCGSDQATESAVEAAPQADPTAMAADQAAGSQVVADAAQPQVPAGPTTKMTFKYIEYDFGTVKDGEIVRHEYEFTNTGTEPLIIADAKASCGCTVPSWPKEPIQPGDKGKIKVEFDSKGKPGPQSKKVTITANTDPAPLYLTIKGNVEGKGADVAKKQ